MMIDFTKGDKFFTIKCILIHNEIEQTNLPYDMMKVRKICDITIHPEESGYQIKNHAIEAMIRELEKCITTK